MYNVPTVLPASVTVSNRICHKGTKVMLEGRPGEKAAVVSAITKMDPSVGPVQAAHISSELHLLKDMKLTYA